MRIAQAILIVIFLPEFWSEIIMSKCDDILKKMIQDRKLDEVSTNILMRHLKQNYKCLLIDDKCYLEKDNTFSTERINFDEFDPFATGWHFNADLDPYRWNKRTKPIACINRIARKLFHIQNNSIEKLNTLGFQGDMKGNGLNSDDTKKWAIKYLLEKSNL